MSKNLSNSVLFGGKTVTNINEIDSAIDDKQPIMGDGVIETTPVSGSSRAVTSGGVFTQLGLKQGKIGDGSVETTPVTGSSRAVTSGGVFTALGLKQGKIGDGSVETTPAVNSTRAVTSGGVFTALAAKQALITTSAQLAINKINFDIVSGDPTVLPIERQVEINPDYDATGQANGTFLVAPAGGATNTTNLDARLDIRGKGNNSGGNSGYQSQLLFSQKPTTDSTLVYKMGEIGCAVSVPNGAGDTSFESRMDINGYDVAGSSQTFIRMLAEDNKMLLRAGGSNRITMTIASTQIRNTLQLKATRTRNTPSGISDNVCQIECEKVTASEDSELHFEEFDSDQSVDAVFAGSYVEKSDMRIKTDINPITNATDTLLKLKPKNYKKIKNGKDSSGLIIQDIWYYCPELRHIIKQNGTPMEKAIGADFSKIKWTDYGWSEEMASMNYNSLIPYLIKSNQELHARIQKLEDMIIE